MNDKFNHSSTTLAMALEEIKRLERSNKELLEACKYVVTCDWEFNESRAHVMCKCAIRNAEGGSEEPTRGKRNGL